MTVLLRAPFPYFGGKAKAAALIWSRLGDPDRYVEPFFGSGAVLLNRPHAPRVEIANDADGLVCNFWRATSADPAAVWAAADRPVHEADIYAFRRWLHAQGDNIGERLQVEPDWYDPVVAGRWMWLASAAINKESGSVYFQHRGQGIHAASFDPGVMDELRTRVRCVRFACGDWARMTQPMVLYGESRGTPHAGIAVYLDPPYGNALRAAKCYRKDDGDVTAAVQSWCASGIGNTIRIAVSGFDGEYGLHERHGWDCVAWNGGGRGGSGAGRERVWFSPACLPPDGPEQLGLFAP